MLHLQILLSTLAIFKISSSLPLSEKIEPVDLSYECVKVLTGDDGQGKSPVLMIHGLGGSLRSWRGISLLLATQTKRRVCAIDLRNHGDSLWNNRTDIEALAVDIGHFLDRQGIKKVNIIGHSLGGKIAIHYTLNNPDRVDSLIVEDNRPNTITEQAFLYITTLFHIIKAALQSVPAGTAEDEAKRSIVSFVNKKLEEFGSTERFPDELSDFFEIKLVDGQWHFKHNMGLLEEALKNPQNFLVESTGLYEGPAQFIYGTKSPFKVYDDKENILKLFPKAQLVPVEGAGHFIHGFFPKFNDEVVKFLNKVN